MKKPTYLLLLIITLLSCETHRNETKKTSAIPVALDKVLKSHGGLEIWKSLRTLSFHKGQESHTTDLWSRKAVIETGEYSLGFDGKQVWVSDTIAYKGNATFYYNLYFYFYAMPFVLADQGIIYKEAPSISYEGINYPGIKISYNSNVGTSPDDNYILYYHPETYQMEWLAYTVTFRSKKPSNRYNLIKYVDWEKVGRLKLPKAITWYRKDSVGYPTTPARPPVEFSLAAVSDKALKDTFYEKPSE